MLEVDRKQVLAYRIAANGLHRRDSDAAALGVFDLGVQDNQRDSVTLALSARLPEPITAESLVTDPRFTLVWSHRGAPHLHRTAPLPGLVPALVPLDEHDAGARTGWQRGQVASSGIPVTEALQVTAKGLRKAVRAPMTKGAASTEVTRLVPEGLTGWCERCQATHVYEQLMRLATLVAGVRLVRGAARATLAPLEGRSRIPARTDLAATTRVVAAYLRLHGPATAAEVAGFIGTTKSAVASMWPDELAEVRVDGRAGFLPADGLPQLENPPDPEPVRLLPAWDPLVQGRDRRLLVPEKAYHKEVWKILGNPGTLLADGEIAGTWRGKVTGKRMEIAVSPFWPLPSDTRDAIEQEASRVALARGFPDARLTLAHS